jgi:DNA-nicking Smr family endonuclease
MEVDLHIHHLIHSHEGMTNGEIVSIQLEHFERIMRIAVKDKIRKVVFIHGVGQGVLRSEIRRMLKSYYPQCEFQDASWQQYGQGATMVTF